MGSEERFGFEWKTYDKLLPQYKLQFNKWTTLLPRDYFKGKTILDAGCGMGRNAFYCFSYGAKGVYALDNDDNSLNSARRLLKGKNVKFVKKSIMDVKYDKKFDLVMSIGVIHHLRQPYLAVKKLFKSVKKGGKLLLWVYGYHNNEWIVKYIDPIRKVTSRLPIRLTHLVSYGFSIPLYLYIKLFKQKSKYMKQLKSFSFKHIHSITFDQLLPKIAYYYNEYEAKGLIALCGGRNIKEFEIQEVNDNSWCLLVTKK